MKKIIFLLILTLVLVSCGTDSHHFKIDGHFLNLNQGEFYVYSPDGGINGMDTIKVQGGRFTYEMPCEDPCAVVIVFPNFSEQPIFAEPGKTVDVKGDASHLKQMTVEGTDDNKLMNKFREQIVSASPAECRKYTKQFVSDHPESQVGTYLISTYFLNSQQPDYREAETLLNKIVAKQPKNRYANRLIQQVKNLRNASAPLEKFQAIDINDRSVSSDEVKSAQVGVFSVLASWSYDSMEQQRIISGFLSSSAGKMKAISISVDASKKDCKTVVERESFTWPFICDERIWEGNAIQKLGIFAVPGNIVMQNGKIIARNLTNQELREKLEALL